MAAAHARFSRIRQVAPMCTQYTESQKMVATATSLRYRVSAISAFCRPTTHTPSITNRLVAIVHTKPVNSNFSPKTGCHGNVPQHRWTPSNTWFLGPTRVLNAIGISIGAAVFAGLTSVTDRPTDQATRSVTIGHIYIRSTSTS